jgi:hypothetical protein
MRFKGKIIEESLEDNRILNSLEITKVKITEEQDPNKRWHIYDVLAFKEDIEKLSEKIKPGFYMHFWKGKKIIVIFKNKNFVLDSEDKSTWTPAIDHGISIGITGEQLDFPIK